MYYYYLVASFFLLAPWLLFIGMAVISKPVEESQTKYGKSRGLCTSPGCVRCNRNKQVLSGGKAGLPIHLYLPPLLRNSNTAKSVSKSFIEAMLPVLSGFTAHWMQETHHSS